ncbi:MAG: flagellar basal body-associated FliL family protein [Pseudomonadota bacterium]
MSAESNEDDDEPKPKSRRGLLVGIVGAVVAGGGGFAVTYTGLLGGTPKPAAKSAAMPDPGPLPTFVPLAPVVMTLGGNNEQRMLRFGAQLEVNSRYTRQVTALMPRITDVLNTYLRALDLHVLESPSALVRIRGQMLRRIQIVTGPDHVHDLLISEFILS